MLNKINLQDEDVFYILGDVIDRNKGGFKILKDMMMRHNVVPILGNHEYIASIALPWLLNEITEDSIRRFDTEIMEAITEWMNIGGDVSISEFKELSEEEREDILDYLSEFRLYEEVNIGNKDFILVHAGLENFSKHKNLNKYHFSELLFTPPVYYKVYFKNKFLVTGHLPTRVIYGQEQGLLLDEINPNEYQDEIYIKNNHISIDCGSGYGGRLGCICLDTLEIFYC